MKVIIAGSRGINDLEQIDKAMAECGFAPTEVVSGVSGGVDRLGIAWAEQRLVPVKRFPANWRLYGRSAGMRRNADMAKYADALVAVWDGVSPGTRNMVNVMKALGKPSFVRLAT